MPNTVAGTENTAGDKANNLVLSEVTSWVSARHLFFGTERRHPCRQDVHPPQGQGPEPPGLLASSTDAMSEPPGKKPSERWSRREVARAAGTAWAGDRNAGLCSVGTDPNTPPVSAPASSLQLAKTLPRGCERTTPHSGRARCLRNQGSAHGRAGQRWAVLSVP